MTNETIISGAVPDCLEAVSVTIWRGETLLLDSINLQAKAGDVTQIAGANGSGKTTLLRVLCGAALADEGEVHWCGVPISKQRDAFNERLLQIGHRPGVHAQLTAIENLQLACNMGNGVLSNIDSVLDALAILPIAEIPAGHLSAGQQRRVALARLALMPHTRCWVLDEPLTALDQQGRDWVTSQILAHSERGGVTVLTTHQPLSKNLNGPIYSLDALDNG
ncbi:MAG: cytochrome c biogenesis heme-transporting ATPase CcmA [Granulosicoccaceae bacterium]